ncbi:MAG: ABC transporter ATP-binding protein/permease, partial [Hyphomicrobiaceae bacterium]
MQTSLFPYIWQHTRREQIWILAVILISMPFYFMALDLPKSIVNGPIQGRGFETAGATAPFLKFSISLPGLSEPLTLFPGFMIGRETALVALSLLFLALVCINGGFKLYINVYKGRLGERMLRRLRFDLVDRVLRFPPGQFRRIKSAEVATMVKDEVEPLGGFIGDAFVQPVFLGGQAITAMAFILTQSFWLGLIAAAIVGVQAFLIPKLRRRLLVLGKERQITARELAGRVGEVVEGIGEIRVNDATNWERADIAHRLGRIFFIRYELYNRKFFVKFLNNFLSQVTPFLFYLIGGWYALRGELDIGQLVAVIAAYKDLPSPIKELIDWDQQRQDVEIKFTQVMEQFSPDQMIPAGLQAASEATPAALARPIEASRLSITDDTGAKLIENVSFSMRPGERIALVGQVNAGGETVSEALARLIWPTSGRLALEGQDILEASEALTGRRLGYVGPSPYFPNQSIRDCLLYGLRNRPLGARTYEGEAARRRELEVAEARASANSELDVAAEWTDYQGAGVEGPEALDRRLVEVLKLVELDEDVYQLGLRSRIDPNGNEAIAGRVLSARHNLRKRLAEPRLARLVEPFDAERYNRLSPIAANLLFGTAVSPAYETDNLPANAHVLGVLEASGLDKTLCEMGMRIAETMIELFGELP